MLTIEAGVTLGWSAWFEAGTQASSNKGLGCLGTDHLVHIQAALTILAHQGVDEMINV